MNEQIRILDMDSTNLKLQIVDMRKFNPNVFPQMELDEYCIRCVCTNPNMGIISYQIQGYVSLKEVLQQYVFRKEEGAIFLMELFKSVLAVNRNKSILFDVDHIYVSQYGETFHYIALPIHAENHFIDRDASKKFLFHVLKYYQAAEKYEIPGYICCFLKSEEFSLPNLILALENLVKNMEERRFLFRRKKVKSFRVQEPFKSIYIPQPVKQKEVELNDTHTSLIGETVETSSFLEIGSEKYPLRAENILIGRSMACDIRLEHESVSAKHVRLISQDGKWYIQDLKSTNGTFLNEKKIQRKMRLKEGMIIHIGKVDCIFHL